MSFFWVCLVVTLIAAALCVMGRLERAELESKFPPISDDEFVALCTPGTNREVALKVRRVVADQLGVEYSRIHPSSRFVEDLKCD